MYIVRCERRFGLECWIVYRVDAAERRATYVAEFPSQWKAEHRAAELATKEVRGLA